MQGTEPSPPVDNGSGNRQPVNDNDNETKNRTGFTNPICKQTYHALPRIYGKKRQPRETRRKAHSEKKHSDNKLSQSKNDILSPKTQGRNTSLAAKNLQRIELSEPKHPSHCSKPNCACRLEEQALRKMHAKRNSTSTLFRRVKLPEIQKFQLEDLESKHKVSAQVQGLADSTFRKTGLQIIIEQNSRKESPKDHIGKTATVNTVASTYNFENLHEKHKGTVKLFKNRHKHKIKFNRAKFQISQEQEQQSQEQEQKKLSTRYKTEQQPSPRLWRSVMVNTVMFKSTKKTSTNFMHLNAAEKDLSGQHGGKLKIKRKPSQLENGLFRVPQQSEYKEYLREYRNMNPSFDLRSVMRSPRFGIQKGEKLVYFGELDEQDKRNGYGILVTAHEIFEGQFENDLRLRGYERNIDGIYFGGYKDGLRSGMGTFCWNNNQIFEGNWQAGTKNGYGVWRSPKGDKYQGEWLQNRQHGHGTFEHKTSTYKGEFKNFLKDGKGQQAFSNGDQYTGEYKLGKPHGKGRYEWKDGSFYLGEFQEGMRQGEGTWIDSEKTKYTGSFKADFKHGKGVENYKSGQRFQGQFFQGNRKKGRLYNKNHSWVEIN